MDESVNIEVLIPDLPESTKQAHISTIYVTEGQKVSEGDALFDVETDKVVLEVASESAEIIDDFQVATGDLVLANQLAMSVRSLQENEIPNESKKIVKVETIRERTVKDDSGRIQLEEVIGNSLFDKRGIICGAIGLILGVVIGAIFTAVLLG